MCKGCYREYGSPIIINDKTLTGKALISRLYSYDNVGGNFHVHLDDWNIDDDFFEEFNHWKEVSKEQLKIEKEIFNLFKSMSLEERASSLGLWEGFFDA